jgi:hypothetical protein
VLVVDRIVPVTAPDRKPVVGEDIDYWLGQARLLSVSVEIRLSFRGRSLAFSSRYLHERILHRVQVDGGTVSVQRQGIGPGDDTVVERRGVVVHVRCIVVTLVFVHQARLGDREAAIKELFENGRDIGCNGIEDDDFTIGVDGVVKPPIAEPDERQSTATDRLSLDQGVVASHLCTKGGRDGGNSGASVRGGRDVHQAAKMHTPRQYDRSG